MPCLSMGFSNETSARLAWRQFLDAGYEALEPRNVKGTWTLYYRNIDFTAKFKKPFYDTKEAEEKKGTG